MLKKIIIAFIIISAGILLSLETLFMLVPSDVIEERLNEHLKMDSGLEMRSASFKKVFPWGLEAQGITLRREDGGAELKIESCLVKLAPLSLLSGRVGIRVDCGLYGGGFKGLITRGRGEMVVDLNMRGIDMWEVGRAVKSPINFPGVMDGVVSIRSLYEGCPEGFVRGRGKGTKAAGDKKIFYRGFNIPLGRIEDYGVDIEFSGCKARVKGVWVKGESLSARVSGVVDLSSPVERSALDLTLELVPARGLAEEFGRMVYLRPYRKSAGYYSASIKGNLRSPVILPR